MPTDSSQTIASSIRRLGVRLTDRADREIVDRVTDRDTPGVGDDRDLRDLKLHREAEKKQCQQISKYLSID